MKTVFVVLLMVILVGGSVSAYYTDYSNPTRSDGLEITHSKVDLITLKHCDRQEWNYNFEQFREGSLSREDMKSYIGGCEW